MMSVNRMDIYSRLIDQRMAKRANGSTASRYPVIRPCAVYTLTWRRMVNRARITAARVVQDLAPDLPLNQDGGHQDSNVDQIHAIRHGEQRVLDRESEALLL